MAEKDILRYIMTQNFYAIHRVRDGRMDCRNTGSEPKKRKKQNLGKEGNQPWNSLREVHEENCATDLGSNQLRLEKEGGGL